jgi:hypothetical protein
MRAKVVNDCVEEEEIELKKTAVDIFQGLLEGQGEKSVVYERVLSVIHLDIILLMSKPLEANLNKSSNKKSDIFLEKQILQTECVVLLQMLCDFKPSLHEELGISRNIDDIVGSGTACIEIIWRGSIHRRFFHVPKVCEFLAKSSKDALVEFVDRSNAENKLIDFLNRSHELYREVKHQQFLTEKNVSFVFSRTTQDRATWFTFILAVVINAIFVSKYSYHSGEPSITPFYDQLTNALNLIQLLVSFFALLLYAVVRSPVKYHSFIAEKNNTFNAILLCGSDPLAMYYMVYFAISLLGYVSANYYCSLLLLDIVVKDSTTRDLLNAVVTPGRAIVMGFVLEFFIIYIFSMFMVFLFLIFFIYCFYLLLKFYLFLIYSFFSCKMMRMVNVTRFGAALNLL